MADLNWGDEQWRKIGDAVTETFGKVSVASSFLPMYGPLEGSTEVVRNERIQTANSITAGPPTVKLDKNHSEVNQRLVNVTANVELTSEQVADGSLSNALLVFRRAANILAHEQDRVVFNGLRRQPRALDSDYIANTISDPQEGLADLTNRLTFQRFDIPRGSSVGEEVVTRIVELTQGLESNHNPGPFACVLGSELYTGVHNPSPALVLPADRIAPLLGGGRLLRATTMHPKVGILVSLANTAVDIVVGTPPSVQFLQRTQDAKFLFRVYTRFTLRIRDKTNIPIAGFRLQTTDAENDIELASLDLAAAEANLT